jgi:hypothetical protein
MEAFLLAQAFRLNFWRIVWLIVVANYVSSFAGVVFIPHLETALFNGNDVLGNLHVLPRMFWELIALLFVITVFVEWPFVFFGFPYGKGRLYKSLLGSLLAQTCSYGHFKQIASIALGRSPIVLLDGTTQKFTGKLDDEKNISP